MADNVSVSSAATVAVAARVGTYSGDASQVAQAVVPVIATGSDDAKTLTDIAPAVAGLDSTGGGIQACAMVAQFDDASTTTVTENQFAHPRLSSRRALLVEGVASGTVLPVSDGAGSLTVDNAGTFPVQDSEKVADNAGFTDGTTKVLPSGYVFDEVAGTALTENDIAAARIDAKRAQVGVLEDATTRGQRAAVSAGGALKVDNSAVTQPSAGDVAHDGVNSGNPIQSGAEAIAHGTNPTAVAAADRTKLYANRAGIPFVIGGHPNIFTYQIHTTGALTDQAMGPAIGSGLKMVVTQMQVVTDNACTAFPAFRAGFGATNTPGNGSTTGQAGVVLSHPGLPAGGGISRGDGSGILGIGADGEELRITCAAPTGGSLDVTVSGYTIES